MQQPARDCRAAVTCISIRQANGVDGHNLSNCISIAWLSECSDLLPEGIGISPGISASNLVQGSDIH